MKLVSFKKNGGAGFGALKGSGIVNLTNRIGRAASIRQLLEQHGLVDAHAYVLENDADLTEDEVTYLPVISAPSKIVCVGLNYVDHAAEAERQIGEYPVIFHRYPDTQTGHKQPIISPKVSEKHDYEGELAVIIGKDGAHIDPSDAMEYVAGYACYNESCMRDWQFHAHQYGMGKNFFRTGGFGPNMTTVDEIQDYRTLTLVTRVNGREMQRGYLKDLAFEISTLISYVSQALPWRAGDVLVTGTPGGVGFKQDPPLFLKDGDIVEVEVEGIGVLVNPVQAES